MSIPSNISPLGVHYTLPAGYTRIEFILKDNLSACNYLLKETFTGRVGVQLTAFKYKSWVGKSHRLGVHQNCYLEMGTSTSFTVGVGYNPLLTLPTEADTRLVWSAFYRGSDEVVLTTEEGEVSGSSTYKFKPSSLALFGCPFGNGVGYFGRGRIYELRVSEDANEKYIFKPCVSPDGAVLLCCVKTGKLFEPLVEANRPPNWAGLTAAQAVTLCRNLSSAGGELKIVLPEGYDMNERVVNALAEGESKGWVLTIQTYAAQTSAATYSLRRVRKVVWCRVTACEHGSYANVHGVRYNIESCVAIYGPKGQDPTDYGYEPFDSEAQAAEQWGLVPYVEPETEENAD